MNVSVWRVCRAEGTYSWEGRVCKILEGINSEKILNFFSALQIYEFYSDLFRALPQNLLQRVVQIFEKMFRAF
jgi:hypothetical protein